MATDIRQYCQRRIDFGEVQGKYGFQYRLNILILNFLG